MECMHSSSSARRVSGLDDDDVIDAAAQRIELM